MQPHIIHRLAGLLAATLLSLGATTAALSGAPEDGTILLLPFAPLNQNDGPAWMGRSVEQSVMADLTVSAGRTSDGRPDSCD